MNRMASVVRRSNRRPRARQKARRQNPTVEEHEMATHTTNDERSEGVETDEQRRDVTLDHVLPAPAPLGPVASMARALAAAYASRRRVLRRGVLHTV
jgi:hypothetical protein